MKRKIKLSLQNTSSIGVLALCLVVHYWMKPVEAEGGEVVAVPQVIEEEPEPGTEPEQIIKTPELMATRELAATLQGRATYLLATAQRSGDARGWLQKRQNDVLWELNDLRKQIGAYDGTAPQFSRKGNLEQELASVELALWWIANPADQQLLPSLPINQPLTYFVEGDIAPTGGLVPHAATRD
jgi:hypothetical protein